MSKAKRQTAMNLQFATLPCRRCGGQRLAKQPCPDCGERPQVHEAQPDLDRRTRLVKAFLARRSQPGPETPDWDSLGQDIMGAITGVQHALARAAKSGESPECLLSAFKRLDGLVAAWNRPMLRPQRNRGRAIGRGVTSVRQGLELFVEALRAPTMLAAQNLEQRGQTLIDDGTTALGFLEESNRFQAISELGTTPEIFVALGADARSLAGDDEQSIETIDRRLLQAYGHDAIATPGMGLQIHLIRYLTVSLLDVEQCEAVAAEMEGQMLASPFRAELCRTQAWQKENGRVTALLSAATYAAAQCLEQDSSDLEVVNAWMDVVIKCRDGLIRHALATLGGTSETEYTKLIRTPAGRLIKDAAQQFPALRLNEGLSPTIRNAAAHLDYDVDNGHVITSANGQNVTFEPEEFTDEVLSYLEVTVGLALGLTTALARLEVDVQLSRHLSQRDREGAIRLFLGAMGMVRVMLTYADGALRIMGEGTEVNWLGLVAGLSELLDQDIQGIRANVRGTGRETSYEAELDAYRAIRAKTTRKEQDLVIDLAGVVAATSVNGASPWSEDQWAGAAIQVVEERSDDSLASRVRRIRRFRGYAESAGMDKVAATCTSILVAIRQPRPDESSVTIPKAFRRPTL